MKYKTLFRLMLKGIGVWLFFSGATKVLGLVGYFLAWLSPSPNISFGPWQYVVVQGLSPISEFAAGLYLFFGGKWIADKAIPANHPYCHECGYDLTGAAGHICTECGTPFKSGE